MGKREGQEERSRMPETAEAKADPSYNRRAGMQSPALGEGAWSRGGKAIGG